MIWGYISKVIIYARAGKNNDIEWRFHLSYNSQAARLVKRKHKIWKQQIKLLTSRTTLARWTKVVSQILMHSKVQPVGPVAPCVKTGSHCWITQCHKGIEIIGKSHCHNYYHGSICYVAKNLKPHHNWERNYLLEFTMRHSTGMG